MGAALGYVTRADASERVRAALSEEAEALRRKYEWWAEGILFWPEPGLPGPLRGGSKLFLLGYESEDGVQRTVDPGDDTLMAWRDAVFIAAQLTRWSSQHRIGWDLDMEGQRFGSIVAGRPGRQLLRSLEELRTSSAIASPDDRIPEVLQAFSDRWGAGPPNEPIPYVQAWDDLRAASRGAWWWPW